jgi:hypothetical protein
MNSGLKDFYLIPKPKGLIEKAMNQSNSASNSGYLLLGVCLAKIGMVFAWPWCLIGRVIGLFGFNWELPGSHSILSHH